MKDPDPNVLDEISKTSFCIPYTPSRDGDDELPSSNEFLPPSLFPERDSRDGRELRFRAYKAAWGKCLDRVQEIIRDIQKSTVASVVQEVKSSYVNPLPGLPHPELPVVSLTGSSSGSSLLGDISIGLESVDEMDNFSPCSVIHLYPGDFPNVSTGMKSVISGFIDQGDITEQVKRKPTTSLASYDIRSLELWYKWISRDDIMARPRILVVILREFEQFDPFVMRDVFYACSGVLPQVPLVFLLSMASPVPNYLNITYPQSTLSLLRIRNLKAPSGMRILRDIWLKTFFDVEFDPDVVVGPSVLEYLQDYFARYNASVDAVIAILQLAHFHHFTSEPLTVLVHDTAILHSHRGADSSPFVEALKMRISLANTSGARNGMDLDKEEPETPASMVAAVDKARHDFLEHTRGLRLGFGVMMRIQVELEKQGHKGLEWSPDADRSKGLCDAMLDLLRGGFQQDVKRLGIIVKKLKPEELRAVLESLSAYFFSIPAHVRTREQKARSNLILLQSQLPDNPDEDVSALSTELSDWLVDYLSGKLVSLEAASFWDIWYTGLTPPLSEVLNPSIRASTTAGLMCPHEYFGEIAQRSDGSRHPLWNLPDTSILFKRYLDSGKMINVYDWFESFKSVLDIQQQHLQEAVAKTSTASPSLSPRKRGRPKSVKGKQKEIQVKTEEEEEKWKAEVQARFIRALHELDYLGFIKHTGRKADHVLRTVFDIDDDDDDAENGLIQ